VSFVENTTNYVGTLQKLSFRLADPLEYFLSIGNESVLLNPYLGKKITLAYQGQVRCLHCGRATKKSYNQGYCFPCSQTLARCDICILRPEKCHYHLGSCREPDWAASHCFIPHVVYIANTSGLKVGITRETQIPIRWVDQGATQALPLFKVQNRYHSGLLEVQLKKIMNDKTDWRKMLRGEAENIDLLAKREELLSYPEFSNLEYPLDQDTFAKQSVMTFHYPVLEYPQKINSLNFDKTPEISGFLLGIKGQYLIMDLGVINLRNLSGHIFSITL
jgi:hypothetical protein